MRNTRRLAALAMSTLLAGTVVANAASAAERKVTKTEVFNATAQATAVHLRLLGNDITLSDALTTIDSSPLARAASTEVLTPLLTTEGLTAEVKKTGSVVQQAESCALSVLESTLLITRVHDASCPRAEASIVNGNPSARALGGQLKLDVSLSNLLDGLGLKETVGGDGETGLDDTVLDSLTPLVEGLSGSPVGELVDDSVQTADDLLEKVLGLDTTVRVSLAPAYSKSFATDDLIQAEAEANGLNIHLLPVDQIGEFEGLLKDMKVGDSLLSITVSQATGSQTYHRKTEKLDDAIADASLVRIRIGPGLPLLDKEVATVLDTLGLSGVLAAATGAVQSVPGLEDAEISLEDHNREIVIKGPGTFVLAKDSLLETIITLSEAVGGAGGFAASGVKLETLHKVPGANGGIKAALADISGGGAGDTNTRVLGIQETPRSLPRTGGTPVLPIAGMGLLGLALAARRVSRRNES